MNTLRMSVVFLAAMLAATASARAAQQQGTPTIIAAKRADAYSSPKTKIEARDKSADVVIVLRIGGLSREEFRTINGDDVYVVAGAERLPPNVLAVGIVEGKPELLLVVVGPRATRDLRLVLGSYPAMRFTAEEMIAAELH
jgi:hypothetical protein